MIEEPAERDRSSNILDFPILSEDYEIQRCCGADHFTSHSNVLKIEIVWINVLVFEFGGYHSVSPGASFPELPGIACFQISP